MKYLAIFDTQEFYGEIIPIPSLEKLYRVAAERADLAGGMVNEHGERLELETTSEEELMGVIKRFYFAEHIHLVEDIGKLVTLSNDESYQKRLVLPFLDW